MTKEEDRIKALMLELKPALERLEADIVREAARESLRTSCLPGLYILKGREIVPASNTLEWAQWMQTTDNFVAEDFVDNFRVSTIFLGLDHGFGRGAAPVLFETMVFGLPEEYKSFDGRIRSIPSALDYQVRYSTYSEAEEGHAAMCEEVRKLLISSDDIVNQVVNKAKKTDV